MPNNEKEARRIWQFYETYRDDTREWRIQRDRNEKFYFGNQWDRSTSEKLEARGQTDIVVNKIRALNRMRVSIMIANKPQGQVLGVHKGDIGTATLLNMFADWHLYNSHWQFHLERVVMGQNRVGIHWLSVYPDNLADYGRGELKVGNESYRFVFLDKAAGQNWDLGDSPRIINTKQLRPEDWFMSIQPKILERAGINKDNLDKFLVPDDEIRWSGKRQSKEEDEIYTPRIITPTGFEADTGNWVREMDIYEKEIINVPVLMDAQGIVIKVLDPDNKPNNEETKQLKEKVLIEKEIPQQRIKWRKCISGKTFLPLNIDDFRKEDTLPIENYSLIPVIDEDTGNSMPLGEIDFQAGIQKVVNAAVSLTLLNASLLSNMKIIVDTIQGGVTDIQDWKKRWAVPGEVLQMRMNPQTGRFPVEIVRPEPLTQAWFSLWQALSQEIEFQISTFSLRTGDPSNAPQTFAATLQLGQWAQDILRIPLSRLELALERLYNLIFQWSSSFYNFEKIFYTFAPNGEPLYQTINFATLPLIKAQYRIRAGSTMPSQTVAELGILQSLAQQQPALIGSVIDRLPGLTDEARNEIKQTIDLVSQLQQSNAQKDEIVNVLQTQLQHLNESNLALQRDKAIHPIKREVDHIMNVLRDTRKGLERIDGKRKKARRMA